MSRGPESGARNLGQMPDMDISETNLGDVLILQQAARARTALQTST